MGRAYPGDSLTPQRGDRDEKTENHVSFFWDAAYIPYGSGLEPL